MKAEEARIAAHVCGDGWLTTSIEKNSLQIVSGRRYRRERKRYEIGYCNTEKILLKQMEDDVKKIYGINARKVRIELRFRSKRVFDRLVELGAGKSREWFVGQNVKNSKNSVKKEWLKAFFDDEATVELPTRRIRVKSMNFKGLKGVRKMLENFNVKSTITGPNIDESWYLTISCKNVENFRKKIGFYHPFKNEKLNSIRFI